MVDVYIHVIEILTEALLQGDPHYNILLFSTICKTFPMQLSIRFRYLILPPHFKVFPSIPYKDPLEAYEVIGCKFASSLL